MAKELDDRAFGQDPGNMQTLSTQAKSILGIYADFVQAKRMALLNGGLTQDPSSNADKADGELPLEHRNL